MEGKRSEKRRGGIGGKKPEYSSPAASNMRE
jgi:hypothetical protein